MKRYKVGGMSCAACSARVERAVSSLDGVESCSVNLLTGVMLVDGTAKQQEVIAAVTKAGYTATTGQTEKKTDTADSQIKALAKRLVWSLVFLLVFMYISMGYVMLGWPLPAVFANNPLAVGALQLLLTLLIVVINRQFFISGVRSIIRLSPNMDSLVSLGAGAALIYSVYVLLFGNAAHLLHELYFESAAMILTLITVGKLLEARSKGKTTDALKGLAKLAPATATLLVDGAEQTVLIEDVKIGDVFAVYPGESIPVDGVVLEGESAIDQSALTGESIPAEKGAGSEVLTGTVNLNGYLKCRATGVGQDTTLAQMIQTVSDAVASKAPISRVADRVSAVFVPSVIAIAIVTVAAWLIADAGVGYALARGISVLVISCPCALGLATPVAIMVASGVGAKHGILFKTAAAIEQAGKIKTVALDKTGTLTKGEPHVTDVVPFCDQTELLTLAMSIEQKSEHPLAKAIISYCTALGITEHQVHSFKSLSGNGLQAEYDGNILHAGSLSYISGLVEVDQTVTDACNSLAQQGKTPMLFSSGERLLGIIAVADTLKLDSTAAVSTLKHMGINVVMLTGDNARTANAIASQAGIDNVMSDLLPDGKVKAIEGLSKAAMVGDGINDAPALTAAHTGIAIGAGTDIAIDAADVVLMNSNLADVPAAIKLSRAALRNIHQNLFWAFVYNVIGIPFAAGLFIPLLEWELDPMFAAAAMSLSSFCVVTNALRLNTVKLYSNKKEKTTMQITLKIDGMMCPHCEARVKKILELIPEVESAQVSHEKGTAVVTLKSEVETALLKKAVEDQGYTVVK